MKRQNRTLASLAVFAVAVFVVIGLTVIMPGQEGPQQQRTPNIHDWSSHHVVFSNSETRDEAMRNGRFDRWYSLRNNPRYQMVMAARAADRARRATGEATIEPSSEEMDSVMSAAGISSAAKPGPTKTKPKPQGDWNTYLGGTAGAGVSAPFYPAKYTWDINGSADCTKDVMVVPVNKASASAANATGTIVINSTPGTSNTVTIGSAVYGFHSSTIGCATGQDCVQISATTGSAANLAAAINGTACFSGTCTADPDVTATVASATVTLTPRAAFAGPAGNAITLATSNTAAIHLNGVAQATSSLSGGADGQASIVAFNQLYTGNAVAAKQTGTVSSNTLTPPITASVTVNGVVLTASNPTKETATLSLSGSRPAASSSVTIGIITYAFVNASTVSAGGTNACNIRSYSGSGPDSAATVALHLYDAIHGGTSGQGTATWECNAALTTGNSLVTSSFSSPTISLTAVTPGFTGFAESTTGTTNITWTPTLGTDGTASNTAFTYWNGNVVDTTSQLATSIMTAINASTAGAVVTAATGGTSVITVTADTAGPAGNSIPVSDNLAGFAWDGPTLLGGTATGPCSGGPSVTWAYKVNTLAGAVLGSPVLSYDGTQVAFVENRGTAAYLDILAWHTGDNMSVSASPSTPFEVDTTGANYRSCANAKAHSCIISLAMGASTNDTHSPPFYEFATDSIYVGDDSGKLWKFTGAFSGNPANAGGTWNTGLTVHSAVPLTGPVPDYFTAYPPTNILVADTGGRVSIVTSAGGLSGTNLALTGAVADTLIEDASTGKIFAFSGGSASAGVVTQAPVVLGSSIPVTIGAASAAAQLHAGFMDNNYWNAPSTGHLYVCANDSNSSNHPALYSIGFTGNNMNASLANGPLDLAGAAGQCSPLQEIFNPNQGSGGIDWLFVGIPTSCAFGGDAGGCIMSFDITSGFPAAAAATGAEPGGTSGIIIDNVSGSGQAASVYFTTLAAGAGACTGEAASETSNCLVKRTQNGLQ